MDIILLGILNKEQVYRIVFGIEKEKSISKQWHNLLKINES